MAFDVRFSERYLADLRAAIDNLWLVSRGAAERFAEDHDRRVETLLAFPRVGTQLPKGRYAVPVGTTGYRIFYRVDGERLTLLRLQNVRRRR